MSRQIEPSGQSALGTDKTGFWVRSVYYCVIVSLGAMLFLVVYLAR
jgi:hypothetical protein